METTKVEKSGVGFGIVQQAGPIVIQVRPHHDTISSFRGVQVGFELLNGIRIEQARKILEILNENIVGVVVTSASEVKAEVKTDVKPDDKTQGASG